MNSCNNTLFEDYGEEPFVTDIERAVRRNTMFRRALWTGDYLQLTLMSIPPGGQIGLEVHNDIDQMLYFFSGFAMVKMGRERDAGDFVRNVRQGFSVFVPAKTWHNVVNTGNVPVKLFSVYAPAAHPKGTVHRTKSESDETHH